MESVTKVPVTDEELALIARDLLSKDVASSVAFSDGWYNAAYGLTFTDGSRAVVKIAPPSSVEVMSYEKDLMASEVMAMRLLEGSAKLPKILGYDEAGTLLGRPLFFMEWVDGEALHLSYETLGKEGLSAVREELGRQVKSIHSHTSGQFGMLAGPRFSTWKEAFTHLFLDVIRDGESKAVDLPFNTLRKVLSLHSPLLEEVEKSSLIHWDLWDGNVFVLPEEGRMAGIIDFERALYADPLMEYCFMDKHPEFLAGYGPSAIDSESGATRRLLYDLYLFMIMAIEGSYRFFPDPWSTQWSRAKMKETLPKLGVKEDELGSLADAVMPGSGPGMTEAD